MPDIELSAGRLHYVDRGRGPIVVLLHGVLADASVWEPVVERLEGRFRCVVPTLPLGAHPYAMHPDADVSLAGLGALVAEFLDTLGLEDVTLVGNDHAAVLAAAVRRPPQITRLVITSCEAFENYPPGLPGQNLRLLAQVPGGLWVAAQLLRLPPLRRLPVTLGWMTVRPLPDALLDSWLAPVRHDRDVRRDLRRYAAGSRKAHMLELCAQLGQITVPTLVVWTPEDRVADPSHGRRLAAAIPGAQLSEVPDSRILIMQDQPERLADLLAAFVPSDIGAHG